MKRLFFVWAIIAVTILIGEAASAQERQFDGKYWHDVPSTEWEIATKKRADLMKDIEWEPLRTMPKTYKKRLDATFEPNTKYRGTPYSSVSKFHGFVGRDVTFYTFLSALHNPESYIYSVNYHNEPWKMPNAGPFYGSVCSSTVCYCWGLPITFGTYHIRNNMVRYFEELGTDLSQVRLYDGICFYSQKAKAGHIMMFYDIARDEAGNIVKLTIFESASPKVRLKEYTPEEFTQEFIVRKKVKFYRLRLDTLQELESARFMEQELSDLKFDFPQALCLKDGDRKSFSERDTVRIDILSKGYKVMQILRDGEPYSSIKLKKEKVIELSALPAGLYEARLEKGGKVSDCTRFQICNTACKVRLIGGMPGDSTAVMEVTPEDPNLTPIYCGWKSNKKNPSLLFNRGDGSGTWTLTNPHTDAREIWIEFIGKYNTVRSGKLLLK